MFDALTVCARDLFVPARYRGEAFIDTPIRLQEYDFNISAPHMHATCLEALEIQPGHRYDQFVHLQLVCAEQPSQGFGCWERLWRSHCSHGLYGVWECECECEWVWGCGGSV